MGYELGFKGLRYIYIHIINIYQLLDEIGSCAHIVEWSSAIFRVILPINTLYHVTLQCLIYNVVVNIQCSYNRITNICVLNIRSMVTWNS
jgi:hypothetical protein